MTPALLVIVLQAAVAAAPPPPPPPNADVSTEEDCAVFVALGEAKFGWAADASGSSPFFRDGQSPDGRRYAIRCPWTKLGVHAPPVGTKESRFGYAFSRPEYDAVHMHATVSSDTFVRSDRRDANGRELAPFATGFVCKLEKTQGVWRVIGCDMGFIS